MNDSILTAPRRALTIEDYHPYEGPNGEPVDPASDVEEDSSDDESEIDDIHDLMAEKLDDMKAERNIKSEPQEQAEQKLIQQEQQAEQTLIQKEELAEKNLQQIQIAEQQLQQQIEVAEQQLKEKPLDINERMVAEQQLKDKIQVAHQNLHQQIQVAEQDLLNKETEEQLQKQFHTAEKQFHTAEKQLHKTHSEEGVLQELVTSLKEERQKRIHLEEIVTKLEHQSTIAKSERRQLLEWIKDLGGWAKEVERRVKLVEQIKLYLHS